MAEKHKRRTRNFFIKKDFQGKIILAIFLAVTLSCLFFIVIFGFFSADTLTISYKNNQLHMGQTPAMLLKNALAANWLFLVICGTLLVLGAIIGTHRIAGPLFRFEKTLDSMIKKNLRDTIYLRGKDEGKDLAAKINDFNEVLSADIHSTQKHSRAIGNLLNQYNSINSSQISQEEIESICKAIQKNNDRIQVLLKSYQLVDE